MLSNKYLQSYKKFRNLEQARLLVPFYLTFLFIVMFFASIWVIYSNNRLANAVTNIDIVLFVFMYVFMLMWVPLIEWKNVYKKEATIFAALTACEELDSGDSVRASLSTDRLIKALSRLLERERLAFADQKFPLRDHLFLNPNRIRSRSIQKYIQATDSTEQFKMELRQLASSLSENKIPIYLAAQRFLAFLNNNVGQLTSPNELDLLIKISPLLAIILTLLLKFAA